MPQEFEFYSCYPNPFNPITTISYSIPKSDNVEISIYNIDGTLEDQLYNGYQTVGNYNYNWDAGLKSSGIYIVKIRFGDRIKTQKVLLLK